jgi:hypothetical protein
MGTHGLEPNIKEDEPGPAKAAEGVEGKAVQAKQDRAEIY